MSTIAERHRLDHFRAKAATLWPTHYYDGTHNTWTGEPLHQCGCGEFESHEKAEVLAHVMSMSELEHIANGPRATGPHISAEAFTRMELEHWDGRANTR